MTDKQKNLEQAIAQIEKEFGKGSIMRLGDFETQNIDVIPTGCLALDIALGVGGIPRGRIVEIYGPESSGKTTVSLHIVAEAQKLGGTGTVEVVVTENDIDDMGQMITFKRGDRYYTCLVNRQTNDPNTLKVRREFSSHKYIDGFNIVKNFEQECYTFTVHYDGTRVVGFECELDYGKPTVYMADDVTLNEDFCVVLYATHTFTIEELEVYFQNENKRNSL